MTETDKSTTHDNTPTKAQRSDRKHPASTPSRWVRSAERCRDFGWLNMHQGRFSWGTRRPYTSVLDLIEWHRG